MDFVRVIEVLAAALLVIQPEQIRVQLASRESPHIADDGGKPDLGADRMSS